MANVEQWLRIAQPMATVNGRSIGHAMASLMFWAGIVADIGDEQLASWYKARLPTADAALSTSPGLELHKQLFTEIFHAAATTAFVRRIRELRAAESGQEESP